DHKWCRDRFCLMHVNSRVRNERPATYEFVIGQVRVRRAAVFATVALARKCDMPTSAAPHAQQIHRAARSPRIEVGMNQIRFAHRTSRFDIKSCYKERSV